MELFTHDPIAFRVYGEPLPFPKKEIGMTKKGKGGRPIIIDRDVKKRKNPLTGKIEVVSRGDKKRWMKLVRNTALDWMQQNDRQPFVKNHPIAWGCVVCLTRAESCKLQFPSQDPDLDNFEYALWNALKRTPAKTKRVRGSQERITIPGPYPNGICFYDDNQIVWRLHPSGVLWATPDHPPGVIITIKDVYTILDEIQIQEVAYDGDGS